MATEQLSVDVVTGMINVSLLARISFKVSAHESLTMLYRRGAEQLLSHGDAFFLAPASTTPVRVHTPVVSEWEMNRVVTYWRNRLMTPHP